MPFWERADVVDCLNLLDWGKNYTGCLVILEDNLLQLKKRIVFCGVKTGLQLSVFIAHCAIQVVATSGW